MPFQSLFDFHCPTRLIHGPGAIARLPELFGKKQKILIVTDKGIRASGIIDQVGTVLDREKRPWAVFDNVQGNPIAANIAAGHRLYQKEKCGAILAVGGGSPIDAAKMIGVLASNGGRIADYLGAGKVKKDLPPLVCVPTTYGTGSEVTPFAVLNNPKTNNKDPVISWKIAPQVGVLDPQLSVALPAWLGAATGMDALTHALESYINLLATPITEGVALTAMELIGANIHQATANDYELEATDNMLQASTLAGIAFAQTRLGNVHAMSHPVGAQFDVHHGTANAILLPYVMDFNLSSRIDKFAAIANALGADTQSLDQREAAQLAVDTVRQFNRDLGIATKLGQVGVKRSGINALAKATMQSGNVAVNPRKTSIDDIKAIFAEAI